MTSGRERTTNAIAMPEIRIFSTCPHWTPDQGDYLARVHQVAQWCEKAGHDGALVYTDNSTVDPWTVALEMIRVTERLTPLVALQPAYMHPYTVAKTITTYGCLYRRRIALNLVAGGFRNDLAALGDVTPHDDRYRRLVEYAQIIDRLLAGPGPVSLTGQYYRVENLAMTPVLPTELRPAMLISGSSAAGLDAAEEIGATPVRYPEPAGAVAESRTEAVRIGIIARGTSEQAWQVAHQRFPPDRRGQLTHSMARKTSDSVWHQRLSEQDEHPAGPDSPYWLGPFKNYRSFCPYLVGDYEAVADEVLRYLRQGCHTFVLDIPADEEEIVHTGIVFDRVREHASGEEGFRASLRSSGR
jgi:alkanesulfonate monooxygenase